MRNGKVFNQVFRTYATDLWLMPEKEFLEWLNKNAVPAIPIPDNATNGDVLKRLLYGKAIITEFIYDVNISVNNSVIGQFDSEWWRSPYKRGEKE